MEEEINQQNVSNKKLNLASYGIVVGFLSLEVLAFVSFCLGQSFLLYGILSIVLAVLLLLVTFRQINKDGIATYAFFIFPILVFGLLTALSVFNRNSIGVIPLSNTIFVPITLTFFSLAGFLCGYVNGFKLKTALLVIYSALGIFVLINFLLTMVYYVPFYTLLYKNSYIVYNGKPSVVPIGSMAYMLFGFQIMEVSIEYWSLFPSLLLTACVPLFFISPKQNRRDFIIYAVLTGIAFISLLFTISKITLLSDFVLLVGIAAIVVVGKVKESRGFINGMLIGIGALMLLVFIILFLNAQSEWGFLNGFRSLLNKNSYIARIFTSNRYSSKIIVVFQDILTGNKIFGIQHGAEYITDSGVIVEQSLSDIWLVDNLMTSGLFGALFFMGALVIGIRRMFIYFKRGDDELYLKLMVFAYVLGFLVISLILYDYTPLINSDRLYPFFISAPLLICLFLISYCFNKSFTPVIKKEAVEEAVVIDADVEIKEEDKDEIITL